VIEHVVVISGVLDLCLQGSGNAAAEKGGGLPAIWRMPIVTAARKRPIFIR
jgi:hypothetical protein